MGVSASPGPSGRAEEIENRLVQVAQRRTQPALPAGAVGRGGGAAPDWLEDVRGYVEVLVVRPGEGAWAATVGDGGEGDDDGAYDGRLRASLAGMRGVGEKPAEPPQRFNPRDLAAETS